MNKWHGILGGAILAFGFNRVSSAQTTSISIQSLRPASTNMSTLLAAIEATEPLPAETSPVVGNFYSAAHPDWPPMPGNVHQVPFWLLGDDCYPVDDRDISDASAGIGDAGLSQANANFQRLDSLETSGPMYGSNDLWLEITGIANGRVDLNLHNATNLVYEIWSKTDLLATNWDIEQEVWPVADQEPTPFTISQLIRTNLFIWARDWTGIDENTNGIPDWWEYKYFGQLEVDPSADPDGDGFSNLQEYQAGADPTDYYNGVLPSLTIVGGNNQRSFANCWLGLSLTIRLADTNAALLTNAPVTFTVTNGGGLIATVMGGATSNSLQLRTGMNGDASVWLQLSATNGTHLVAVSVQSGTNAAQVVFTEMAGILPLMAIGGERIMQLTTNGNVISWGGNQDGELGDDTHLDSTNPVYAVGLTNIVKIAAGVNHALAIDARGTLWAWGKNEQGQLGNSGWDDTNYPVQVPGMTNSVIAIAAMDDFSAALKADGTVWAWGQKRYVEYTPSTNVPVSIQGLPTNGIAVTVGGRGLVTLVLMNDGTVWTTSLDWTGDETELPAQVPGLSNIVAICAGESHCLALASNGTVFGCGYDVWGQLGDGGNEYYSEEPVQVVGLTNVVAISAGLDHSLAVDSEGQLWAWGYNCAGQLGTNGFNHTNLPFQILEPTNIVAIAAGSDASVAMDGDGHVWQWGSSDGNFYWWNSETGTVWTWGDTNGCPRLAPTCVDFYNGQLPNLTILNGDNQTPRAGMEFPQPLVFQVTDANGVVLSNAPVSVEVISGDMELRVVSGGDNHTRLRLTTDSNDEVFLIGYADWPFGNSNCVVKVLAASREQVVRVNFAATLLLPLPIIHITNPIPGSVVSQPIIELQGYASGSLSGLSSLSSLSYDISNSTGILTNLTGYITGQAYDANLMGFSTNWFQAITLH